MPLLALILHASYMKTVLPHMLDMEALECFLDKLTDNERSLGTWVCLLSLFTGFFGGLISLALKMAHGPVFPQYNGHGH